MPLSPQQELLITQCRDFANKINEAITVHPDEYELYLAPGDKDKSSDYAQRVSGNAGMVAELLKRLDKAPEKSPAAKVFGGQLAKAMSPLLEAAEKYATVANQHFGDKADYQPLIANLREAQKHFQPAQPSEAGPDVKPVRAQQAGKP